MEGYSTPLWGLFYLFFQTANMEAARNLDEDFGNIISPWKRQKNIEVLVYPFLNRTIQKYI